MDILKSVITLTSSAIIILICADAAFSQAPANVGVFIINSAADSYAAGQIEQGMQLAAAQKTTALSLKYFNATDGSSPDSSLLKSFVEKEKPAAVVYLNTEEISSVATYLSQSGVVGLISLGVNKNTARLGSNIFGFGYSTEITFKDYTKFAGKILKSYRFAVLSSDIAPYSTQTKVFIEETKSLGNTIVFEENTPQTDYSKVLARAINEKCDTIFAALSTEETVKFIKAARSSAYKGKLLVGDTLFTPQIKELGQAAEGVYMVQAWSADEAFKNMYSAKYAASPDGITLGLAALGSDLVNCLADTGMPLSSGMIKYSFLSKSCIGLTGETKFSGERTSQRKKRILTVKNSEAVLAE